MAPRSGYEAVYADLLRTKEAEGVLDTLRMWCGQARVMGYDFRVDTDNDTGLARTWTLWKVEFGPVVQDFRDPEYTKLRLDFDKALEEGKAAKGIVEPNFGVPGRTGTRNCRLHVVKEGQSRGRGVNEHVQRPFAEALLEHVNGHATLAEVRRQSEANLHGVMIRTSQGEEFARRRAAKLCEAARSEVKRVMLKYREVPDSVLAEAVREAAVEGVMEW